VKRVGALVELLLDVEWLRLLVQVLFLLDLRQGLRLPVQVDLHAQNGLGVVLLAAVAFAHLLALQLVGVLPRERLLLRGTLLEALLLHRVVEHQVGEELLKGRLRLVARLRFPQHRVDGFLRRAQGMVAGLELLHRRKHLLLKVARTIHLFQHMPVFYHVKALLLHYRLASLLY